MTSPTNRNLSSATRAVRAAIASDTSHGAVVPPLHLSANFAFEGFNKPRAFDYTRSGNPTRSQLADAIAELEGGKVGVVTSTGMSAVTLLLQLLDPQDTIVAAHDCYGGTQRLLRGLAGRGLFGLRFADLTNPASLATIAEVRPRIVWIETPSNPLLRITDIRAVADAAHAADAIVVVDNTFLSPALQQPLALGADVVLHSTTKYLNGHSDVVGGAVVAADPALGEELGWWANCLGITGAPFDSYLTLRGIRTLHARIRHHLEGAQAIVDALRDHPAVGRVFYPGLTDHPGHEIARRQQTGFGAMVSFELAGGTRGVEQFVNHVRCFTLAESLGGVESLVAHPATMTHSSMTPEARTAAGISDSLVRLSVGIESPEDLVADLRAALDAVDAVIPSKARDLHVQIPHSVRNDRVSDVVLVGVGAIGRELIEQLGESTNENGLRIVGLVDRSGFVHAEGGLSRERLAELRQLKASGQPLAESIDGRSGTAADAIDAITSRPLNNPILVDATAADLSDVHCTALAKGFDLVLANKIPLATDQSRVDRLHAAAGSAGRSILCEATVGAGLPVLDTLRKLQDAGDEVLSIEGCPSGTLGFLFGEMSRGEPFSDALRRAISLGYTEPDPRIDLSGIDVARKALILARAIGYRGELADVRVESLVPDAWAALTRDEFLRRVIELDGAWATRVNELRRKGKVLRYRAHVTRSAINVGLTIVKLSEPLATLTGTDNQFTFTTRRYSARPLVITGPGAGAAVTAAGVFNDLLWLARGHSERSTKPGRPAEPRRYSPPRRVPHGSPTQ